MKMIDDIVSVVQCRRIEAKTMTSYGICFAELFRMSTLPFDLNNGVLMATWQVLQTNCTFGPVMHRNQTNNMAFLGDVTLYLWLPDVDGKTCRRQKIIFEAEQNPSLPPDLLVSIPPGVVYEFMNRGLKECVVLNFPNQYIGGRDGKGRVDERFFGLDPDNPYEVW